MAAHYIEIRWIDGIPCVKSKGAWVPSDDYDAPVSKVIKSFKKLVVSPDPECNQSLVSNLTQGRVKHKQFRSSTKEAAKKASAKKAVFSGKAG